MLQSNTDQRSINGSAARSLIAKSAQDFIEVNFQAATFSWKTCVRHTGVGIRTVQRCFREYFDLSVTDYLKTVRLDKAYRELAAMDSGEESVTAIALAQMALPTWDVSPLHIDVRFGESPSETLAALPAC